MTGHRFAYVIVTLVGVVVLVGGTIAGIDHHRKSIELQHTVDRYNALCFGVSLQIQIAAKEIARGSREEAKRIIDLPSYVIEGCASKPIDLNPRDACWIADDMRCLARELLDIDEQLKEK